MTNAEIAAVFERIGLLLKLTDANPFRIRAYENAAQTVRSYARGMEDIYADEGMEGLEAIPGIGKDLAQKSAELIDTGTLAYLKELEEQIPVGLLEIADIQGMGPKKTAFVWKTFGVTTLEALEGLARSGKLTGQKGWGETSVGNVLLGIEAKRRHAGRILLAEALPLAEALRELLDASGLCTRLEIAGSVRRQKETIGDIDLLASGPDPAALMELFTASPLVERVLASGETKSSVRLKNGPNADLRVVPEDVFGAALHYFTGSKEHNVAVRQAGIRQGLTISEYGVYRGTAKKKGELLASRTEEDVYAAVGLPFIPPELREGRGELQAARQGALPVLMEERDIRADLHMHSRFSDGTSDMIAMARAAKALGRSVIAITDHASPMGMVRGIKEGNMEDYLKRIAEARAAVPGIRILAGAEVDILEDGSLYLSHDALSALEWVTASVHGQFKLSSADQTQRLIKAVSHPLVHALSHPTARLLLKRDGIAFDHAAVFAAAALHRTALEVNASYDRMDLDDVLIRRAKEAGALFVINSDAHAPDELSLRFGISQARRGWLTADDVLNAWAERELLEWIGDRGKATTI